MPNMFRVIFGFGLCLIGLISLFGCGGGQEENPNWPKRFPAKGTVTYQGKAIEGAEVAFMSNNNKATATGITDSSGKFVLSTYVKNDGAVAGDQTVTIRRVNVVDKTPKDVDLSAGGVALPPEITWIIPEKFSIASKSGLKATVSESGPNDFPFDLK
jgi:hypothetical protein